MNIKNEASVSIKNKTNIKKEIQYIRCPYCENTKIIKFGKVDGQQRYRCKNSLCRRTFTEQYFSPLKHSKKFKYMWQAYLDLMNEGLTIRECANTLSISIVTSFMWRHKILHNIKIGREESILRGYVELTKLALKENFKGSRYVPGGKRERINVVSAIDSSKKILSKPVCKGGCRLIPLRERVFSRIDKKAYSVGYMDRTIIAAAIQHNRKGKKIIAKPIDREYSLKIKRWMEKFHGVATKYIEDYLSWHIFLYKNLEVSNCECLNEILIYISWCEIKCKKLVLN